jgi:hypothetical protein
MTETEWLAGTDPQIMLDHLGDLASHRKLQLFSCACCRRLYGLFPNAVIRRLVETAERDADELAEPEELRRADEAASSWLVSRLGRMAAAQPTRNRAVVNTGSEVRAVRTARCLVEWRPTTMIRLARETADAAAKSVFYASNDRDAVRHARAVDTIYVARVTWRAAQEAMAAETAAQASLLREIFGNPFRPVDAEPWPRPDVSYLAEAIYDEHDFDRLPELADAVEDAGCTDPDLLRHLRGPGPHVRGCWALDLLTQKS